MNVDLGILDIVKSHLADFFFSVSPSLALALMKG